MVKIHAKSSQCFIKCSSQQMLYFAYSCGPQSSPRWEITCKVHLVHCLFLSSPIYFTFLTHRLLNFTLDLQNSNHLLSSLPSFRLPLNPTTLNSLSIARNSSHLLTYYLHGYIEQPAFSRQGFLGFMLPSSDPTEMLLAFSSDRCQKLLVSLKNVKVPHEIWCKPTVIAHC